MDKVKQLWNKADALYNQGHLEEESQIREEICRLLPKDAYARHNYALSLLLAGKFTQAEEQFIITLQLDPRQTRAHSNYGQLLFLFRRDVEAASEDPLD